MSKNLSSLEFQFTILWKCFIGRGPGVLLYSLGKGVPRGLQKSYPLLDQILQILWPYTRLKMLNCSWFQSFVSDPIKWDPILDQISTITRPYTRPNGLKIISFTRPNGFKTIPIQRHINRYSQYMGVPPRCIGRKKGYYRFTHTHIHTHKHKHTHTHTRTVYSVYGINQRDVKTRDWKCLLKFSEKRISKVSFKKLHLDLCLKLLRWLVSFLLSSIEPHVSALGYLKLNFP